MAFGGEVDDAGYLLVLHQLVHLFEVTDVSLDKFVVRLVFYVFESGEVAGVSELVDVDDVVVGIFVDEESYNVGADEAGAASYYN